MGRGITNCPPGKINPHQGYPELCCNYRATEPPQKDKTRHSMIISIDTHCHKGKLLLLHIVRNAMTVTTFCEFIMDCCAVWLSVAFLAGRQPAMFRMAFGAGQDRMLCLAGLQKLVWFTMAAGANLFALGYGIGDRKRGVHWVTGQTVLGFQCCHGTVVLVTFCALGDTSMFLRMTGGTLLFGMLADLSLQAGSNLSMAQPAAVFEGCRNRNGHQRLVGVSVTFQALHNRFRRPVGCIMAATALWHDLAVIITQRVVGMKDFMAFGTGHCLVHRAIIFEPVVVCRMTAGTLF